MRSFIRGLLCPVTPIAKFTDIFIMIIIIRHIPRNTLIAELDEFVTPALKRFFFRSGSIVKTEILILRDIRTNKFQYHGLVHLDSQKTGQMVIKKLRGKRFKNRVTIVREYVNRSWHNDKRNYENTSDEIKQKRVGDRRGGSNLEVVKKGEPIGYS